MITFSLRLSGSFASSAAELISSMVPNATTANLGARGLRVSGTTSAEVYATIAPALSDAFGPAVTCVELKAAAAPAPEAAAATSQGAPDTVSADEGQDDDTGTVDETSALVYIVTSSKEDRAGQVESTHAFARTAESLVQFDEPPCEDRGDFYVLRVRIPAYALEDAQAAALMAGVTLQPA